MRIKTLTAIVAAVAIGVAACGTRSRYTQQDYDNLRSQLAKLEQETAEGKALVEEHCASCHGKYVEGSSYYDGSVRKSRFPIELKDRKTGEVVLVDPPALPNPLRPMPEDYARYVASYIVEGGTFMPPISNFPQDKSGNPSQPALEKLTKFILRASDLRDLQERVKEMGKNLKLN